MEDEKLFTQEDPLGYKVTLSRERYNHFAVMRNHTEVSEEDVKKTIAAPEYIYKGTEPNNRFYYARGNSRFPYYYTTVVVAEYDDEGDVRTAYIRKDIGGPIVPYEEGGCLYGNVNNKL